jgi:restriction system protein
MQLPVNQSQFASFDFVWSLARALWPLLLALAAVRLLPIIPAVLRNRRLAASGLADIDAMDGKTFEDCLGALFGRLGYRVEVTPYRGDWGADMVLVKAKRYKKAVGVRAVQEAVAAKAKYRCTETMVVTNATFTRQAVELAWVNRVALWDREKLVEKLLSDKKAQSQK